MMKFEEKIAGVELVKCVLLKPTEQKMRNSDEGKMIMMILFLCAQFPKLVIFNDEGKSDKIIEKFSIS